MCPDSKVQPVGGKIKVGFRQGMRMVLPYAREKTVEQVKSVWLIIVYLILFLWLILRMPVAEALLVALGIGCVIVGLTFFMEGLFLGLMPLGEVIGLRLPQKSGLPTIIVFAIVLGIGATFAEPAIGVLKAAGSSVLPWNAPLLFLILNKYSSYLVLAVAIGVGVAVMLGMLRFMYGLSLKPFIYIFVGGLIVLTLVTAIDPNLRSVTGLAWDCGAVTTGPVTVPLILALGIGVCRVVGRSHSGNAGFGVVTLASLSPVLAVLVLGLALRGKVTPPMPPERFFGEDNRSQALALFNSFDEMLGCAFWNADEAMQSLLFENGQQGSIEYLRGLVEDESRRRLVFGADPEAIFHWAAQKGSQAQRMTVFGSEGAINEALTKYAFQPRRMDFTNLLLHNALTASQAIIPLAAFLLAVLLFIIRERLPHADQIILGITFALIGMMLFSIGVEIGLGKLGNQVGNKLPALFQSIPMSEQRRTLIDFDPAIVQTAVTPDGDEQRFFYIWNGRKYEMAPFDEDHYDSQTGRYDFIPTKGPLFRKWPTGLAVLLVFAFLMGYGATLAEPALNALGHTVEELTVGTFRKPLLMHSVALGVGAGIAFGVAKIVWGIPLVWLLTPPYMLLLLMTLMSTEEFVNIGWDSAGVTTGPVTVPLVLVMGLGIGNQVGVVEGFGILAMASVCPIVAVLTVGLLVTRQRKSDLVPETSKGGR